MHADAVGENPRASASYLVFGSSSSSTSPPYDPQEGEGSPPSSTGTLIPSLRQE